MSTDSFDGQQALVLRELRRARGSAVSYADLQRAGVEFPASVVSELELSGVPIERRHGAAVALPLEQTSRSEVVGQAANTPGAAAAAHDTPADAAATPPLPATWSSVRIYRPPPGLALLEAVVAAPAWMAGKSRRRHPRERRVRAARLVASLALVVVAVGLLGIVVSELTGGSTRRAVALANVKRVKAPARPAGHPIGAQPRPVISHSTQTTATHATSTTTATQTTSATTSTAQAASATTSTQAQTQPPSSSGQATQTPSTTSSSATSLEAQGHQLMESNPAAAVPVLERAVGATGEHGGACVAPTSQTCLTYAYALYDLGRALQLSGHSRAAVPVLEQRLKIDNQRPTVAAELQVARRTARHRRAAARRADLPADSVG